MPAPLPPDELDLIARAAAHVTHLSGADPRGEDVRHVALSHGHDFATALLYDLIRRSERHRRFAQAVDAVTGPAAAAGPAVTLILVPGALHLSHPETGADGRRVLEVAARLGYSVERVPLPDFAPAADNAQLILHCLARRGPREGRRVIVSLSKGSLDVRRALALPGAAEACADVAAWVDLSGIPDGSREIDWLLRRPWWRWALRGLCAVRRLEFEAVREMRSADGLEPDATAVQPAVLPLRPIRVVGFPLRRHLSCRRARLSYDRLAALGPSDGGGVLLGDLVSTSHVVYPVWGADHYLRPPWDVTDVIARVIRCAAVEQPAAAGELKAPPARPTEAV